jgi:hypothetical protein
VPPASGRHIFLNCASETLAAQKTAARRNSKSIGRGQTTVNRAGQISIGVGFRARTGVDSLHLRD